MGSKHLPHFIFSVVILICAVCYIIANFIFLYKHNNDNNWARVTQAHLFFVIFILHLRKYFQVMSISILFVLMIFFMSILKAEYKEERGGVNIATNRKDFSFYSFTHFCSFLTALTLAYGRFEKIYCPRLTLWLQSKFLFITIGIFLQMA